MGKRESHRVEPDEPAEALRQRMFALVLRTSSGWFSTPAKVCLAVLAGLPFWGHVPTTWQVIEGAGFVLFATFLLWPGVVTTLRYPDGSVKLVLGAPQHRLLVKQSDRGKLAHRSVTDSVTR